MIKVEISIRMVTDSGEIPLPSETEKGFLMAKRGKL